MEIVSSYPYVGRYRSLRARYSRFWDFRKQDSHVNFLSDIFVFKNGQLPRKVTVCNLPWPPMPSKNLAGIGLRVYEK